MNEITQLELPPKDANWACNTPKNWPKLSYEDLVDYLIKSKAYDGKAMKAFRALYGYNYVENGWLGNFYDIKVDNIVHFLKANVSPSQPGVGRSDYTSWIAVSIPSADIITAHCTCPAGNGRSCSHVSAVIYAVTLSWKHGVGGETCTDIQQAWGKGASKSLTLDCLSEINFNRPDRQLLTSSERDKVPAPIQFLNHEDLKENVENSQVQGLWNCKGTMLFKALNAPPAKATEIVSFDHGPHKLNWDVPIKSPLPCQHCSVVFEKYVKIGEMKCIILNKNTEKQNSCMWTDARKFRITASKVNSIPKRADPQKFVTSQIYTRFKGCAATRHGQKYEPVARKWFEDVTGLSVDLSGLCVSKEEPYIAASPDGLVDDDTILEIKCPTRQLQALLDSNKYDIVVKDGQTVLNPVGRNGYYCQVQMIMFCTKRQKCKFLVWTADQAVIVDVQYNAEYVQNQLCRIRQLYFESLIVRISDEMHFKRLKISPEYSRLCNQ